MSPVLPYAFVPVTLVALAAPPAASPAASPVQATLSFSDQTAAAGLGNVFYQPSGFQRSLEMGGLAVGDFDRDGWQDLFALSGYAGGLPDRLFINQGDGTFVDEAASWGLTAIHNGKGISVADYDADGWLDVYITSNGNGAVTNLGEHKLYRNNGDRTFSQVASAAGVAFTGTGSDREDAAAATFADYDLDGDLDLFVAAFQNPNGTIGKNKLFQNQGDGTFVDVTDAAGLFPPTDSYQGFAVRFVDMNGDRYPELLAVGDLGTSHYYVNEGDGTFTDRTAFAQVNKGTDEMGATVLDFDNDGRFDWFVTDIYWPEANKHGNQLYRNLGGHQFQNVAASAGVADGQFGWGAVAFDADNDGWIDLAHTNGSYIASQFLTDPTRLFLNNGDGTFVEVAQSVGLVHTDLGRGMVDFDYDNDGDRDLVIASNLMGPLRLFRNDLSGTDAHWLRVQLEGDPGNGIPPQGYGSVVKAEVAGMTCARYVVGSDNYMSQSEVATHFGLGSATTVDVLRVEWPNGGVTELFDVAADQVLIIAPPSLPPALLAQYNDAGNLNPLVLDSPDLPVLGTVWDAEVDVSTVGFVFSTALLAVDAPLEFTLGVGVLLIDPSRPHLAALTSTVDPDQVSRYAVPLPSDPSVAGFEVYCQAVCLGSANGIRALTNGLHLTAGY